ncbi:MAG: hypothetical protein GY822_05285, partial [Deltaproteobacteria bacterium]|nr:hypothetical protein [Deltaproteobacteria bacterium]
TFPPKVLEIDHALGTYDADDYLELWGVRDLPEPYSTPFPEDGRAAKEEPHASRIFDVENDGHLGVTMENYGVFESEVYFIQRRISGFHGLILSPDELMGFLDWNKVQITLDASNPLLNSNLEQAHHPDPKEHWFHEVRLVDGADCDDVVAAVENEELSHLAPF